MSGTTRSTTRHIREDSNQWLTEKGEIERDETGTHSTEDSYCSNVGYDIFSLAHSYCKNYMKHVHAHCCQTLSFYMLKQVV